MRMIQPGDILLYRPTLFSPFGWLIALKTWHWVSHCEAYLGSQMSVASRDGIGVNIYLLRTKGLTAVLRPREYFDQPLALGWLGLRGIIGQKYDWLGLLRFAWRKPVSPIVNENRQFCSEFLTRWCRAGGVEPFNGADADEIAPFQFLQSNAFRIIWRAE